MTVDVKAAQDPRTSALLAARNSARNLSQKRIIDKRFNRMLFNMHGVPVQPNVVNQQKEKDQKKQQEKQEKQDKKKDKKDKKNKKDKNVDEQHV